MRIQINYFIKYKWLILITTLMIIVIGFSIYRIILSWQSDISGWAQVIIETLTLPVIAYQIYVISRELGKTAEIQIGVVGIDEYPLSNIRQLDRLPTSTTISRGYTFFCLVVRNIGNIPARYMKIHLEFTRHEQKFKNGDLPPVEASAMPVLEVSESGNVNKFTKDNNTDFIFQGGSDWILRPHDSEKFDFYVSSIIGTTNPAMPHQRPYPCRLIMICTIWAEDLKNPISQMIEVDILDR